MNPVDRTMLNDYGKGIEHNNCLGLLNLIKIDAVKTINDYYLDSGSHNHSLIIFFL